ncbi:MAG: N-acetylmuramoyl-L-alanine amidase [Oscillospiraceae bacterium]|nr:N-acetylmuramoyl-L-alanine amidase [Oscillospiraceae bacterium]MBQ4310455.1 N-acetylmuramoyl-L-alanine amidase [Oscillospiraceae bacterium]
MLMKRSGNTAVITVLAMFFGIGVICYAASRIDRTGNAVYVSTVPDTSTMIVLDAGHGGIDGGCSTADGIPEKGINLDIMLSVRDMSVIFGYSTVTTRDTDMSIHDSDAEGIRAQKISDMENRLEIFNKFPDAVCLSIHQNTYTDPKFNGAQMFYSKTNPESAHLASIMQGLFKENLQPYNERETKLCGNELYLCHFCKNPAVMAECGFLSNPDEAAKLTDPEYRRKVAFTLFEGLNRFITERKR